MTEQKILATHPKYVNRAAREAAQLQRDATKNKAKILNNPPENFEEDSSSKPPEKPTTFTNATAGKYD